VIRHATRTDCLPAPRIEPFDDWAKFRCGSFDPIVGVDLKGDFCVCRRFHDVVVN